MEYISFNSKATTNLFLHIKLSSYEKRIFNISFIHIFLFGGEKMGSTWSKMELWLLMDVPSLLLLNKRRKDTLINDISCKKFPNFKPDYTYESNDTVFFFIKGKFRPTYYFNAAVGDTITFYNREFSCFDDDSIITAIIDSIDTIQLSNKLLRRFHPKPIADTVGLTIYAPFPTYTEYLGSSSFLYPIFYRTCLVDQESYGLCVYKDNLITYSAGCINSVSNLPLNRDFKIHPNPAKDFFSIEAKESGTFHLYNAVGQMVLSYNWIKAANQPVSIRDLPSGLYNYQFVTGDGDVSKGKLVKE